MALAEMESRLWSLIGTDTGPLPALLDRAEFSPSARVRFLLFTTAAACALNTDRISSAHLPGLIRAELGNHLPETPEGMLIDRARWLLSRLVWNGCNLRGELETAG